MVKLETERLILRDYVKDDWQRVLEYQSDPLYLRYYELTERTPQAAQEFVGWFLDHQKQEPRIKFQLALVLKSNHQLLISNYEGVKNAYKPHKSIPAFRRPAHCTLVWQRHYFRQTVWAR